MIEIEFVEASGASHRVRAAAGTTLMHAAVDNRVPGVLAECGGTCACATCHVFIETSWRDTLPAIGEMEAAMIQGAINPGPTSRLACQIELTERMNGMRVRLPANQI
jgi:ferredoxin, 2Fe-2S